MLILEGALGVFLGGWALIASLMYCNSRRARKQFASKMSRLTEDEILMLVRGANSPEEMAKVVDNMHEHNQRMLRLFPESPSGDPT
jgi:hypothetical protein